MTFFQGLCSAKSLRVMKTAAIGILCFLAALATGFNLLGTVVTVVPTERLHDACITMMAAFASTLMLFVVRLLGSDAVSLRATLIWLTLNVLGFLGGYGIALDEIRAISQH